MLTQVLLYHVVSGELFSSDLSDGDKINTLEGNSVTVSVGMGVMINDANVVTADVEATNGVVHIIDAVLIPPTCEDSTSWYKTGDPSKDCAWVAEHAPRCDAKGFDRSFASYACPVACGTSCSDSTTWFKVRGRSMRGYAQTWSAAQNNDPSKTCAWVSVSPTARCDAKGFDKSFAASNCPTACATVRK